MYFPQHILGEIHVLYMYYSGTSNKRTLRERDSLSTKDPSNIPKSVYIYAIHFNFRKEDSLPTKEEMAGPKVSFSWRFHCIVTMHVQIIIINN